MLIGNQRVSFSKEGLGCGKTNHDFRLQAPIKEDIMVDSRISTPNNSNEEASNSSKVE